MAKERKSIFLSLFKFCFSKQFESQISKKKFILKRNEAKQK